MKNLVIDIGNSRVKLGLFEYTKLTQKWVRDELDPIDILQQATNLKVQNIILSTVRDDLPKKFVAMLKENFYCLLLNAKTSVPIKNRYKTPETLGKDRLAAVVGASVLYPSTTCLVVDAGTCMTMDVISNKAEYLGGNIAPGIRMRLKAMHQFTARLPQVEIGNFEKNLGLTTETALQNGALLGAALEIEALEQRLSSKNEEIIILLTGGDAAVLANRMKKKIFVHSNLVLVGLNKILNHNVEKLA